MNWIQKRLRGRTMFVAAAACGMAVEGCDGPSKSAAVRPEGPPAPAVVTVSQGVREQLLEGAIGVLGRLDDFEEAAAYAQVFDRLNQWSHSGPAASEWHRDPLVESLPERLRRSVGEERLEQSVFDAAEDVVFLRDQRWLSDIAAGARGDAIEDLGVAEKLFTWVVRSLAIVTDPPGSPTPTNPGTRWFPPGEILLSGRASGAQRAWIFLELLRHAGLDGVMLATRDASSGRPQPWIPALVSGDEAYLFDPVYGMPIPGSGGRGIATVRAAAADPSILSSMNIAGRDYPVQSRDLGNLSVLVSATPQTLSRRMRWLESHLTGKASLRLSVDASSLARRGLAACSPAGAKTADGDPNHQAPERLGLWEFPFEVLAARGADAAAVARTAATELAGMKVVVIDADAAGRREIRPLFLARVREFRGDLDGPRGAKAAYLLARPPAGTIREIVAAVPPPQADLVRRLYEQMKEDATYHLGLLMLQEGQFEAADDYLGRMTLEANPDSRWADAARVALASALVPLGREKEAVKLLENDESPQRFGSRITARRLGIPSKEAPRAQSGP